MLKRVYYCLLVVSLYEYRIGIHFGKNGVRDRKENFKTKFVRLFLTMDFWSDLESFNSFGLAATASYQSKVRERSLVAFK